MKILVVACYYKPAYVYGGPVKSVSQLCEALVQRGHDITVLTTNSNGASTLNVPVDPAVNVDGVQVHYLERKRWAPSRYFYAPDMNDACEHLMPFADIVYVCATWTYPMIPAASAARKFEKPYIISPRGDLMEWSLQQKSLKKKIYMELIEQRLINGAAAIHCTSEDEIVQYQKLNLTPSAFIVPNGMDLTQFDALPERGALRKHLGIPDATPVSLFVGRLHKMKGLERMINEFASVLRECPDAHLIVAGEDEDGSGVRAMRQVNELGLNERVRFIGPVYDNDLLQAYADSDLFVLLSHRENFGMVVVEAMACGLPVLLSREVALAGDVEKHHAGIVVNPDFVAQDWITLLRNPSQRKDLSGNGMSLAREKFSSDKVAEQMEQSFSGIIQQYKSL